MIATADIELWEILVPTEKRRPIGKRRHYTTRYHRVWDAWVRNVAGGLTVFKPSTGQWQSPTGETFIEKMIPVRIACTREQIEEIIDFTARYYDQLAVMCYRVSDLVLLKHFPEAST